MPKNKVVSGKLKQIADILAQKYKVKIGLLASQGGTEEVSKDLDLAGLGAVHEFGATIPVTEKMRKYFRWKFGINLKKTTKQIKIPARSFLYEPLMDKGFRDLVYEYVGDLELFKEAVDDDALKQLAKIIGEAGLLQIQKAFDGHGINGDWAPNSPMTVEQKGSSMQLVDTGELRRHITYEIENQ